MLVEAAGRLFGTLDLDAVLPDVLDLAQSTLAVDAYSLWRRDPDHNTWTLQASAGLSPEYVAAAPAAIRGNESVVTLDTPLVMNDIPSIEWLTPEHKAAHAAEGTRVDDRGPAAPRRRGHRHARLLLAPPAHVRAEDVRAASAVASLAAAAIGTASVYQKQAQLAETRRLLAEASDVLASSLDYETTLANVARARRPGSPTGASSTSSARTARFSGSRSCTRIPRRSSSAQSLIARLPVDPDSPRGVPAVIRTQQARVAAGDRGRAARGGFPRPSRPARRSCGSSACGAR